MRASTHTHTHTVTWTRTSHPQEPAKLLHLHTRGITHSWGCPIGMTSYLLPPLPPAAPSSCATTPLSLSSLPLPLLLPDAPSQPTCCSSQGENDMRTLTHCDIAAHTTRARVDTPYMHNNQKLQSRCALPQQRDRQRDSTHTDGHTHTHTQPRPHHHHTTRKHTHIHTQRHAPLAASPCEPAGDDHSPAHPHLLKALRYRRRIHQLLPQHRRPPGDVTPTALAHIAAVNTTLTVFCKG